MGQKDTNGHTKYQKNIIKNYYENKDNLLVQKLGELVSNLYLETGEKKIETGWKRVKKILADMKVHPNEIEYLTRDKNLKLVSQKIEELF